MMRGFAWMAAGLLVPSAAWALDPLISANTDIACVAGGGETFYPYGDVWAFLPGAACKGVDPSGYNMGLEAEAAEKTDVAGHCVWVGFDKDGPIRKTGSTGTTADHAERARRVVFASMRKWAGYRMGQAKLGGDGFNWYCPATSQPLPADPAKPVTYTTKVDYTFSVANNVAQPTLNFFRGPDIDNTVDAKPNRGDVSECYAECASGQSCAGLGSVSVGEKTLFLCTEGKTDPATIRYRAKKIRHNVIWVKGAGEWKKHTGAGPEVLASTEVVYWQDTGVIFGADMLFNNELVDWQFHDPAKPNDPPEGCDSNAATCYYLETVATHEAGHFIGLGHVACEDAVMFPSTSPTVRRFDLTKHEAAGVCSLYRPSSEGRYPSAAREGEGCLNDAQCGAGNVCLFSRGALYQSSAELAAAPSDAERLSHRGLCVRATACNSDSDCDPIHGRVCQEVNAKTGERRCVAGAPGRPRGTVADYCTPCENGAQCNGICASTRDMGIALGSGDIPEKMCTSKCDPAIGCGKDTFTCTPVGAIYACVPNNAAQCIANAAASKAALNEDCTQNACAGGLTCFAFSDTVRVCLEACAKTQACKTPGYGCLLKLQQGEDGKVQQLDDGACFKKDMNEGDNCALSTNAMCGLSCTGSGATEQCTRNEQRLCIAADTAQPDKAKCYTLCSANLACSQKTQTCAAVGLPAFGGLAVNGATAGVCDPPIAGLCLKGIGEACANADECDTGLCQNMGEVTACTQFCDLQNRSGCPLGTSCVSAGNHALCKPSGAPVAPRCGEAQPSGCTCASLDGSGILEIAVGLGLLALARRRRSQSSV